MVPGEARRRRVAGRTQGGATEPSAGEREGAPLARKQPSAGEREGAQENSLQPGSARGYPSQENYQGPKSAPRPAPSASPVARPRSSTMQQASPVAGAPRTRLFHGSAADTRRFGLDALLVEVMAKSVAGRFSARHSGYHCSLYDPRLAHTFAGMSSAASRLQRWRCLSRLPSALRPAWGRPPAYTARSQWAFSPPYSAARGPRFPAPRCR